MPKQKTYTLIIIISLIMTGLYIGLQSCQALKGQRGASKDIKESRKRQLFVCEYSVAENPVKINDSLKIAIKEAWLEKHWRYGKNIYKSTSYDGYQLMINSTEKDLAGVCFEWSIGVDFDMYLRSCSKDGLMGDFKELPSDTLVYLIQKGQTKLSGTPEIIGKLILIKKNKYVD